MKKSMNIKYFWKEGIKNIFLHGFMSFAAMSVIIACLLITGTVALLSYNIQHNITILQQESEIVVFIDDALDDEQVQQVGTDLKSISNVFMVEFISGEDALDNFISGGESNAIMLEGIPEDYQILRDEYHITLKDISLMELTIQEITAIDGIANHRVSQDTVQMLLNIQNVFKIIAWGLVIALGLISIFIISNTVKLAMFSRRDEIAIQKMVGATNWFIRWPFVIEGMILGMFAGGLAFLAQWGIYTKLLDIMSSVLSIFDMVAFDSIQTLVLSTMLGAGVVIGVGGSVLTIRRFMDV